MRSSWRSRPRAGELEFTETHLILICVSVAVVAGEWEAGAASGLIGYDRLWSCGETGFHKLKVEDPSECRPWVYTTIVCFINLTRPTIDLS